MNIEIKKLTPEHVEEYIRFFDTTPHDDLDPASTCYCVSWCSDRIPFQRRKKIHGIGVYKNREASGILGLCGRKACRLVQCQHKIGMYELRRLAVHYAGGKKAAGEYRGKSQIHLLFSDRA